MLSRTRIIQKLVHFNEKLVFYPKLRRFYSSVMNKGSLTVIDVGCNKGQSINFFKGINKDAIIFGFEPNRKLYNKLLQKYRDNTVQLFNKGVSNIEGKLVFHENIMDETSTFEKLNYDSDYLKKKAKILGVSPEKLISDSYEVEVTTLKRFLSEHDKYFFDVLKIDVEGHELSVLQGLFGTETLPVRYIQIESHNDDMYLADNNKEIEQLLKINNFLPVTKIKHGFGDFYEVIYENKNI